jgi:GcrA cell cycle regulator
MAVAGFWTPERVEQLKRMLSEGHSCSVIGNVMGASRNAIIGKIHRLDLPRPDTKQGRRALQRHNSRLHSKKDGSTTVFGTRRKVVGGKSLLERIKDMTFAGLPREDICAQVGVSNRDLNGYVSKLNIGGEQHDPSIDIARKALVDLDNGDCRWPVGDPQKEGFGFCAAPRIPGKPYCKGHLIRAERPIEEQPREIRIAARAERVKEDA